MAVHFSAASWLHIDWTRRLQQTITGQIARIEIVKVSGHDGWEWLIPSIKMLSTFALLDLIDINFRSDISAIVWCTNARLQPPSKQLRFNPALAPTLWAVLCQWNILIQCVSPPRYHESREEMRRWLLFTRITRIINKNIITICLVVGGGTFHQLRSNFVRKTC